MAVIKRILAVFLAMAVTAGLLCGCGGTTTQNPGPSDETTDSSRADHGNEITVGIARTWMIVLTRIL